MRKFIITVTLNEFIKSIMITGDVNSEREAIKKILIDEDYTDSEIKELLDNSQKVENGLIVYEGELTYLITELKESDIFKVISPERS